MPALLYKGLHPNHHYAQICLSKGIEARHPQLAPTMDLMVRHIVEEVPSCWVSVTSSLHVAKSYAFTGGRPTRATPARIVVIDQSKLDGIPIIPASTIPNHFGAETLCHELDTRALNLFEVANMQTDAISFYWDGEQLDHKRASLGTPLAAVLKALEDSVLLIERLVPARAITAIIEIPSR